MAKRDPEKTARNKEIDGLTTRLKILLPDVLQETGIHSDQSLHALYGGKFANYIDIKNAVVNSPEHFISLYLEGFKKEAADRPWAASARNLDTLRSSPKLQEYLFIFLERVYLRNIEALSKKRPKVEEAEIWIGQNNANYGLLVTPRFNALKKEWENDKSEIRHFEPSYFTIGHLLMTGLTIPGRNKKVEFNDVEQYLTFFQEVLVRNSGSPYEYRLAEMYCDYVRNASNPRRVPLLIPEFRYDGRDVHHKYRLDFTIIHPHEFTKVGFELSPWSTHGYLSKTKSLTQAEINEVAKGNFEKQMKKHKDFFRAHGIYVLIYTDTDLKDLSGVFLDMKKYLEPTEVTQQLRFHLIRDILGKK